MSRKPLALGMAAAAAVLAVSAAQGSPRRTSLTVRAPARSPATERVVHDVADEIVKAPVRIADAAAVRLLQPGDRVDVLAAARVVASAVPVVDVPGGQDAPAAPEGGALPSAATDTGTAGGALVVLAVPRRIAAALSGAAVSSPLAVALC